MTPENFCYWLRGYFDISKKNEISVTEVQEIRNNLYLIFGITTPKALNTTTEYAANYCLKCLPKISGIQLGS